MGLDVSFFKDLKFIGTEGEEEHGFVRIWNMDHFKDRNEPLKFGYYSGTLISSFNAGSYYGYNAWRAELCKKILGTYPTEVWKHPKAYKEFPFYYLIDFVDNDGTIAGDAFKKLQKDFKNHDVIFDDKCDTEKYQEWKKAMLKSECVVFH